MTVRILGSANKIMVNKNVIPEIHSKLTLQNVE